MYQGRGKTQQLLLGRVLFRGYSQNIEIARSGATPAQLEWLPSVANRIRARYNPEFRYAHFVMISMTAISVVLLGMILAFPMAFLSGTVVRVSLDCGMFHRRREESKRLNTVDQPMVIISASGMASDYKTSCWPSAIKITDRSSGVGGQTFRLLNA